MADVVSLKGDPIFHAGANPDVVALLQEALTEAESGELTGVVVAKVYRDGSSGQGFRGVFTDAHMAGVLEKAKHQILAETASDA